MVALSTVDGGLSDVKVAGPDQVGLKLLAAEKPGENPANEPNRDVLAQN